MRNSLSEREAHFQVQALTQLAAESVTKIKLAKTKKIAEYRRERERGHVSGSTTRPNWRAGYNDQLTVSRRQEAG